MFGQNVLRGPVEDKPIPYALDAVLELLFKGNERCIREGGKVKVTWQTPEEVDGTLVWKHQRRR